ncbi:hypothetical protein [Halocalculus aciditolerans]|uniref:Uncharacterized protein n=1 Tax=Halocalculus aciditolerans TaxID=1383812 RepID=A0A830FLB7_9EURY|nr:hypothetical protein [Halocalculus aciditolerans]GGL63939.1 hypothetical protein GCM10009039_22260 [Halocalculus aciditolerans]
MPALKYVLAGVFALLLVGAAVGVADPFYAPPTAEPVDASDAPRDMAVDALDATAHGDYRVDWAVSCDDRDWYERDGQCVFQRYHVEHSEREYIADNGAPFGGVGPDVYASEAGYAAYNASSGEHVASSAVLLWDNRVFNKSRIADAVVALNATVTETRGNGTVVLTVENDRLVYGIASNALPNPERPPDGFEGALTLRVDAETGWLQRVTTTTRYPTENATGSTTYYYDRWGNTTVERPSGADRAPLAWLRDAINWEYRP